MANGKSYHDMGVEFCDKKEKFDRLLADVKPLVEFYNRALSLNSSCDYVVVGCATLQKIANSWTELQKENKVPVYKKEENLKYHLRLLLKELQPFVDYVEMKKEYPDLNVILDYPSDEPTIHHIAYIIKLIEKDI